MPNIWLLRANFGEYTQRCVDGGFHGLIWQLGDCSPLTSREAIAARWDDVGPPEDSEGKRRVVVGYFTRFLFEVEIGDWVLTPEVEPRWLRYGRFSGEYQYEADAPEFDSCPYQHRRAVVWEPDQLDRREFSVPFQNSLKSNLTLFKVRHENEFLSQIGISPTGAP